MTQLQAYNLLTAAMQNKTYQANAPFDELIRMYSSRTETLTEETDE